MTSYIVRPRYSLLTYVIGIGEIHMGRTLYTVASFQ